MSSGWLHGVTEPRRRTGWISYHDSAKTSVSPLALAGGTRTRLTIDGLGSRTVRKYHADVNYEPWDDNKLVGQVKGEAFLVRLGMSIKTTEQMFSGITGLISALLTSVLRADVEKENTIKVEFDFGAFTREDTLTAPRKQNDVAGVTRDYLFHSGDAVLDPGGTVYLTSKYDAEVYDVDLMVHRIFTP